MIITLDRYYSTIQSFAQWKHKKGISTKVVKISEIGGNEPEVIKDFIASAYCLWEIIPEYVLIVGDVKQIKPYPHPVVGSTDNPYADVNNDTVLELQIGRLPCRNRRQLRAMIAKIFNYERTPYLGDTMFYKKAATIRQDPGPFHNAGVNFTRNMILDNSDFISVDTFVKPAHNRYDVHDSLKAGRSYLLYTGHGLGTQWADPFKVNPYVNNRNKTPVIFSWSCRTVLEQNYLGQKWLKSGGIRRPKGAVAFIGATSSGLYARYRNYVARNFFRAIFQDKALTIGSALKQGLDSLWTFTPDSFGRVLYSEFNLLGDPSLNLWTTVPKPMTIHHDTMISSSPQIFNVNVTNQDGKEIAHALVCLSTLDGSDFYHTGYTDSAGQIRFAINPSGYDRILITVTAQNYRPYENKCVVVTRKEQSGQSEAIADLNYFTIYPNPAKSYITVHLPHTVNCIKIYDATGKLVKVINRLGNPTLRISLSGINPGIYFITDEGKTRIERLTVIK
ncbi:MAG: T9SS type A sorting domain-containing protein [Candidatus Latescibacteria bacterium]|nr:T9SS type A sorting domain-containing protein [Candidatus Latescibacterota bacterium]